MNMPMMFFGFVVPAQAGVIPKVITSSIFCLRCSRASGGDPACIGIFDVSEELFPRKRG